MKVIDGVLISVIDYDYDDDDLYDSYRIPLLEIPDNLGIVEIGKGAFKNLLVDKIIIPKGVKKIAKGTFYNIRTVKEIVLPDTLKEIGENAFRKCPRLRTINLPAGLKKIEEDAFAENDSLTEIIVPDGVVSIGKGAFRKCKKLRKVVLPNSIEEMGIKVFEDCESLESANIPNNIKVIPIETFKRCRNLVDVSYAQDIESIGYCAFQDCEKLEKLNVPDTVTLKGNGYRDETSPRIVIGCENLQEFEIPEGPIVIGDYDYSGMYELKRLKFPSTVTHIRGDICTDSENLSEIELPYDLRSLYADSFNSNKNISTIKLYYFTEEGEKRTIEIKVDSFNEIRKHVDRFIILTGRNKQLIIATKEWVKYLDGDELLKITNCPNFTNLDSTYDMISLYGRYDVIPLWNEMKKKSGQSENMPIPPDFVISTIPSNVEDIKRYYQRHKVFEELFGLIKLTNNEHKADFLKLCYSVGLFSGNKEESTRAFDFIKENIENGKLTGDYIHFTYDGFNLNNGYSSKFAEFYIRNFADNQKQLESTSARMYNEFKKILKEFKKTDSSELDIGFVLQYLIDHKYDVRYGNEMLAKEVSKYSDVYDAFEFDQLQDLFEKARRIAERQSKKIVDTYDKGKKYTYFWTMGDNPVNVILGNEVNCCARLGGAGQGIMEASMFDASVRNLVIYNKDKQIVGKATAYFNARKKYILFNNIEMSNAFQARVKSAGKREAFECVLRAVYDQVEALNSDSAKPKVTKVAMGMRLNDLEGAILESGLPINHDSETMLTNYPFKSNEGRTYGGDASDPECGQVILWEYQKKNARSK